MTDLNAVARRQLEEGLTVTVLGHEQPHHLLFRGVALDSGGAQRLDERALLPFDPQLEDATAVPLQRRNRPAVATAPLSSTTT